MQKKKAKPIRKSAAHPTSIVGVGASAGGLEALEQLLAALPANTGMAFVLIQHLAPKHESILSELLRRVTKMPVIEVRDGTTVQPDHVYVIPPDADMSISHGVLHLTPRSRAGALRMPIDLFLRSLAEDQQSRAIGVVLSGTASDGTLGLQAIKAMGGITFAQDDSAKYTAMPRNAIAGGNVDLILPPDLIARDLDRIAKHAHALAVDTPPESADLQPPDETLSKIFLVLRNASRVDFSYYKPGTVKRRIARRMFLKKVETLQSYLQYLRKHPAEVEALFNDVLINVTAFFRDPDAFEALKKTVFPAFVNKKPGRSAIRIWVPGCATGEEAYSLAMILTEFLGDKAASTSIQIFATDVSEPILNRARLGFYPQSVALDVPADRLRRFFLNMDGGYQVSKSIRDMCVFAKQDLVKDPPFSRLDLISCRNVMIYMAPVLQKRIVPLFHYALNPGGVLFLGSSETVSSSSHLFELTDKKHKIYTKKTLAGPLSINFVPYDDRREEAKVPQAEPPARIDLQKVADQILLNRYAPAGVMVNDDMDIVHFIGQTGRFLEPSPGDASLNLMRMVKSGLHTELRLALEKAKRNQVVRKEAILVESNGSLKKVNFEVIPVKNLPPGERYYLIVFEFADSVPSRADRSKKKTMDKKTVRAVKTKPSELELENKRLQEELEATREYLQSIIEEQRTTNEELRSANEEIQSSNEELQSINEELETAKEELQSTNEELTTVNEELQNRNDELTVVNSDLNNLLSSVNIPIVILGNDLRIRRFTPLTEKVMNLIPTDIGRPITDIKSNLKIDDLKKSIAKVLDSLEIFEGEVEDSRGKWYSMRIRPYRTLDNKIDGVVIVFLELDVRLKPKSS